MYNNMVLGLDGFQKSLCTCALDECSLSIGWVISLASHVTVVTVGGLPDCTLLYPHYISLLNPSNAETTMV